MIVQDEDTEPLTIITDVIKVISCDISSLQEAFGNGFPDFVKVHNPDIVCLQVQKEKKSDVALSSNEALNEKHQIDGYKGYIIASRNANNESSNPVETVLFTKIKPIKVSRTDFEEDNNQKAQTLLEKNDNSIMTIEFTNFFIVNAIAPGSLETEDKVSKWYDNLQKLLNDLNSQKTTMLCGNFKVAHQVIDINNSNDNEFNYYEDAKNRKRFSDFLSDTYVDIFRNLHPEKQQFSYLSSGAGKSKCRIDYFIAPNEAIETKIVVDCSIASSGNFSKHLPIVLLLDKEKLISTEHDLSIESLPPEQRRNEIILPQGYSEIQISNTPDNNNKEEIKNEVKDEPTPSNVNANSNQNSNTADNKTTEVNQEDTTKSAAKDEKADQENNENLNEDEFEYDEYVYDDEIDENESSENNEEEEIQLAHGHKIVTRRNKGRFFDFSRHAVSSGKGKNRSSRKYDDDDYAPIKKPNVRSKAKPKKTDDSNPTAHRGRGRPKKNKPEK